MTHAFSENLVLFGFWGTTGNYEYLLQRISDGRALCFFLKGNYAQLSELEFKSEMRVWPVFGIVQHKRAQKPAVFGGLLESKKEENGEIFSPEIVIILSKENSNN